MCGLDLNNPCSFSSELSYPSQYNKDVKMGVTWHPTITSHHIRCDIMSKINIWYACGSVEWNGMHGGLVWLWLCFESKRGFWETLGFIQESCNSDRLWYKNILMYICSAVWGWLHQGSLYVEGWDLFMGQKGTIPSTWDEENWSPINLRPSCWINPKMRILDQQVYIVGKLLE